MIKASFIISLFLLLLFAIWRYLGDFFIDETTLERSFNRHLPYLLLGAIVIGTFYIFFFVRAFPKGWNKQSQGGKIAIVIIFLILAFAILRQGSITLNFLLPGLGKENLRGVVIKKEIEKTRKGTKFYHIIVNTSDKKETKSIAVSKKVYNKYSIGDTLQKEIVTGYLGIKYAKE